MVADMDSGNMSSNEASRLRSHLRLFHPDASILLLGLEGAGKKTLGIIASIAWQRQYIEFNRFFAKEKGCTTSEYVRLYSSVGYQEAVTQVVENLLAKHSLNCVISGLPQSAVRTHKDTLKSFCATNPVVYVQRDKKDLKLFSSNLRDEQNEQIYSALDNLYKFCSNLDYFNVTQLPPNNVGVNDMNTLKLKHVETDFIRFTKRIFGQKSIPSLAKDPFSDNYSYALQLSLQQLGADFDYSALECGADAINLSMDATEILSGQHANFIKKMAFLRRESKLPIILDIQYRPAEGNLYFKSLNLALRTLPDVFTINLKFSGADLEIFNSIKGFTKTIGIYHHNGTWTRILEQHQLSNLPAIAMKLQLHALRISTDSSCQSDNFECIEFAESLRRLLRIPIAAYNTGSLGRTSICFNKTLSPVTLESVQNAGITVKEARSALYLSFVLDPLRFTIFGSSVSYSLSPAMHNAAYESCGLPHRYGVNQSGKFEDIDQILCDDQYGGVTVSMPFKVQVLPRLDVISPEAREIGAVNTIIIEHERQSNGTMRRILKGYNTDYIGIRECFTRNLSTANSIRTDSTALIIGAGGMARAAIYAFKTMGIRTIFIYNRTRKHAEHLVEKYSSSDCNIYVLEDLNEAWPKDMEQPKMVISTIPAHSFGGAPAHSLTIPTQWLRSTSGGTFIELAYKPLVTRFIEQIRAMSNNGWIVVDGLEVLLEQGIAQFELFTGISAPVNAMRNALRKQFTSATRSHSPDE